MTALEKLIFTALLCLAVGLLTGFFYRAHLDYGDVAAQQNKDLAQERQDIIATQTAERARTQLLLDAAAAGQAKLQGEIDDAKTQVRSILAVGARDRAALNACRVPVADLGVWTDAPAIVPAPNAPLSAPSGPGHTDAGALAGHPDDAASIGCGDLRDELTRAHGAFDANVAKLGQCVARYDECRAPLTLQKSSP